MMHWDLLESTVSNNVSRSGFSEQARVGGSYHKQALISPSSLARVSAAYWLSCQFDVTSRQVVVSKSLALGRRSSMGWRTREAGNASTLVDGTVPA